MKKNFKMKNKIQINTIFTLLSIIVLAQSCSKSENTEPVNKIEGSYTLSEYQLVSGPNKIFGPDGNGSFKVIGFNYDTTTLKNENITISKHSVKDSFRIYGLKYPEWIWPEIKVKSMNDSLNFDKKYLSGPLSYSLIGFIAIKGDSLNLKYTFSTSNLDYSHQFDSRQVKIYSGKGIRK